MQNSRTRRMVFAAMMTAISLILIYFIRWPFPLAQFLVYDPGDVPLLLAAFTLGPGYALVSTIVVSVLQALLLSSDGWVGALMHILSTGALVAAAGIFYKAKSKPYSAGRSAIALVIGALVMTVMMCLSNLTITVWFYGYPRKAVLDLLPTAIIPFNLLKSGINSAVSFLILNRTHKYIKLQ